MEIRTEIQENKLARKFNVSTIHLNGKQMLEIRNNYII
jgi:hypothetical protein